MLSEPLKGARVLCTLLPNGAKQAFNIFALFELRKCEVLKKTSLLRFQRKRKNTSSLNVVQLCSWGPSSKWAVFATKHLRILRFSSNKKAFFFEFEIWRRKSTPLPAGFAFGSAFRRALHWSAGSTEQSPTRLFHEWGNVSSHSILAAQQECGLSNNTRNWCIAPSKNRLVHASHHVIV